MRVISKQISLEHFTSRLPGVVPAYIPGHTEPIYFNDNALKTREYVYPSNYGLVPMAVKIGDKCLSWERISDWYHLFTGYYHLLNDWGHCGLRYSSAVDYYDHESKNGYSGQLKYSGGRKVYQALDDLFNERRFAYDTIQKCIPSMDIPSEYQDYWHAKKLYYPDVIKWLGWFKSRSRFSSITNVDDCINTDDCCECKEYVNRGGADMANKLQAAYDRIQSDIDSIDTCNPWFSTDISLQVSIDDMGEFSIFSEEYELGRDYRGCGSAYTDSNTEGGTVVSISGDAMTLVSGSGFGFDPKYQVKTYDGSQWKVHDGKTEVDGIPEENEDVTSFQEEIPSGCYGFNSRMVKVTGNTEDDVRAALAEEYVPEPLNAIFINGGLYNVSDEEYGYYKGEKLYYVYRDLYTDTPYTNLNGKRIYADIMINPNPDDYFYFPFFISRYTTVTECGVSVTKPVYKSFPRVRNGNTKSFITYGGASKEVNGTSLTINGVEYQWVIGVFTNADGQFYVGKNGTIYYVNQYAELVPTDDYYLSDGVVKKYRNDDAIVYQYGVVTGKAESEFILFRSGDMLVDDTGVAIEGRYKVTDKKNHQPAEGEELGLLFEVGNISNNMKPFKVGDDTYYYGNQLIDMYFYCKTLTGDEYTEDGEEYKKKWSNTSLDTIHSLLEHYEDKGVKDIMNTDVIYCDVTYVMGGTFTGTEEKKDDLVIGMKYNRVTAEGYCQGVLHWETVKFVRTEVQYNLAKAEEGQIPTTQSKPKSNPLSYPVVCYILEEDTVDVDDGFGNIDTHPVATFNLELPEYGGWYGYSGTTQVFPVFRQEYKFGNSMMQKVDANIYIQRGINAAFEKHLKLGEVTSMEALEQYTNGYFKMQDK